MSLNNLLAVCFLTICLRSFRVSTFSAAKTRSFLHPQHKHKQKQQKCDKEITNLPFSKEKSLMQEGQSTTGEPVLADFKDELFVGQH